MREMLGTYVYINVLVVLVFQTLFTAPIGHNLFRHVVLNNLLG
jgi:hypothetical protein